jgi:hypothetical protein
LIGFVAVADVWIRDVRGARLRVAAMLDPARSLEAPATRLPSVRIAQTIRQCARDGESRRAAAMNMGQPLQTRACNPQIRASDPRTLVVALKLDHITLLSSNITASMRYYAALLPLIGFRRVHDHVWTDDAGFFF